MDASRSGPSGQAPEALWLHQPAVQMASTSSAIDSQAQGGAEAAWLHREPAVEEEPGAGAARQAEDRARAAWLLEAPTAAEGPVAAAGGALRARLHQLRAPPEGPAAASDLGQGGARVAWLHQAADRDEGAGAADAVLSQDSTAPALDKSGLAALLARLNEFRDPAEEAASAHSPPSVVGVRPAPCQARGHRGIEGDACEAKECAFTTACGGLQDLGPARRRPAGVPAEATP